MAGDLRSRMALSRALFGGRSSGIGRVEDIAAVAVSSSYGGLVEVEYGGEVLELPTVGAVSEGDIVHIIAKDGDPFVIGTYGEGDRQDGEIATASSIASGAAALAEATGQHFFADDAGAHVTTDPEDALSERNVLLNSLGLLLRRAGMWLTTLTSSALTFWDGLGNGGSHSLATFGSGGARVGRSQDAHVEIDAGSFSVMAGDDVLLGVSATPTGERRVYRCYKADYVERLRYDSSIMSSAVIDSPADDPDVQMLLWWQRSGMQADWEPSLWGVDELVGNGDISARDTGYAREAVYGYDMSPPVAFTRTRFDIDAAGIAPEDMPEAVAAQVPRDLWTPEALAHGAPNVLFGSVYGACEPTLQIGSRSDPGPIALTGTSLTFNGSPVGGVSDYAALTGKPSIGSVELSGDRTFAALGLVAMGNAEIEELLSA